MTSSSSAAQPGTVPATRSSLATKPVWLVGVVAAIVAAVVNELIAQAAKALDVSVNVGFIGATVAEPIPDGGFASSTLMFSAIGIILAVVLAKWAKNPAKTFLTTTVVLTVLSCVPSVLAGATEASTKALLVLTHLVAAAIFIPVVTRRLAAEER